MGHPEMRRSLLGFGFFLIFGAVVVESKCSKGCDLALASFYAWRGSNLSFICRSLSTNISQILKFNPQITNPDYIKAFSRINVPFPCDCINGEFLGHSFLLSARRGATYRKVAEIYYSNLTTVESLLRINSYNANFVANTSTQFNVTVNCSCGDASVSKAYGLFVTYPLQPHEDLSSVARASGLPLKLLQGYNPDTGSGLANKLVFIPGKDQSGNYPPLKSSGSGGLDLLAYFFAAAHPNIFFMVKCAFSVWGVWSQTYLTLQLQLRAGISSGIVIGIPVAGIVGLVVLALCVYVVAFQKRKAMVKASFLWASSEDYYRENEHGSGSSPKKNSESADVVDGASSAFAAISVNKAVEYSYKELAKATNNFGPTNKIGQGGFGAVFYAELRGERAAIKKMDMQASKEFLAELKVLTHVHHLNLVRLLGYCIEGSLFLVYEFIENGTLSQHLHGMGGDPLPWSTRVQIALDSARGLEYIHEHTVPTYIHRDIKPANILIDINFHAKVADFGLTKLLEVGGVSLNTGLVGTFGYMPPEYAQYGDVSPKIDIYAFGVVLYELISAKDAIVKTNETVTNTTGLVALFEDAFSQPNPLEELCKLVDPRIGSNYPIDSVHQMAMLARACTQENPQLRPSMRSVVVALMALFSSTGDWDAGTFYENQALLSLMSER